MMNENITDNFFTHIINGEDYDEMRRWLKKQKEHEIRVFHDTFNFQHYEDRRSLLAQELERRHGLRSGQDKWIDRLLGFLGGGFFIFLLQNIF